MGKARKSSKDTPSDKLSRAAKSLGKAGGKARAAKLTRAERSEIARNAGLASGKAKRTKKEAV